MSKYSLSYKDKDRKKDRSRQSFSQTKTVARYTDKHGRLKLKKLGGKKTKELQAQCTHHMITRSGKPKSRVIDNMDQTGTCRICGQRFPTAFTSKAEIHDIVNPAIEHIQMVKWVLQAGGGDQKTMDMFCQTDYLLRNLPKVSSRVQTVFRKQNDSRKKKRNRNNNSYNASYGHWTSR